MLCLIVAFTNDISLFFHPFAVVLVFITLILMIASTPEDYGIILILTALFVLSYNNIAQKKTPNLIIHH